MLKRWKKNGLLVIVMLMAALTVLAGCAGGSSETANDSAIANSASSGGNTGGGSNSANNGGNEARTGEGGQNEKAAFTYWVAMPAAAARSLNNYNESLMYQELEKRTGVHIEFQHPAVGSAGEQFNLMIASGNLPDMIETNWLNYPGGPEKAIADNIIIPLNDLIERHAPNYKAFLDQNPEIRKQVLTDNGTHYVFPAIGVGSYSVSNGLMLRRDWLEELSLEVPETIEEWAHVLRGFKEKKGAEFPLSILINDLLYAELFNGAFGIGSQFYVDGGKVKYGPYEEAFRSYLELLNQWYEEGLLDPDFAIQDSQALDSKVLNGQTGAFRAWIGSGMGKYFNAVEGKDTTFDLVGAPYPVMNKGEEPKFINSVFEYRGDGSVAITTANKNPEASVKWLDYFFSEEGNMLKSFGIEGVTYVNDNGYPRYTDLIVGNPDGLSVNEAMDKYLRVSHPAVGYVGDDRYYEQYYKYEQQKEAAKVFGQHAENAKEVKMPPVSPTPEEASELATIMAEVNTYRSEAIVQFIMGGRPLDSFGEYREQLQAMGIERAIELQQAALDRYNNRN